jgi:metallophosphoesterase (TIGR03767 family)
VLLCVVGGLAPRALGHAGNLTGKSTVDHRLVGTGDPADEFALLKAVDGEPYLVRDDLGTEAQGGRKKRRVSLIYLGQITDFQLADEESPAREERFDSDPTARASTSGYRPQEPLVIHQVELSIRQMDHFLWSPVRQGDGSRAKLANAVMTGDLADSMQHNETKWVRQLLEGGRIDPNSGTLNLEGTKCEGMSPTALDDPRNYTGVGDYDDYADDNPIYYDPESPLGFYLANNWPTYPGLFDAAQKPFQARGLEVPSYVAFGNHDQLYQGTVAVFPGILTPGGATWEDTAIDCLKPVFPTTNEDAAANLATTTPDFLQSILTSDPSKVMQVPPDFRRRFVDRSQFKDIFRNGKQKDDHGFAFVDDDEEQASNDAAAYYSFSPKRGIRYIVLDTNAQAGLLVIPTSGGGVSSGSEGNIDHPQWQWLVKELDKAEAKDELVIVFGHHATGSLNVELPDEVSPCIGQDQHGHDKNVSCDLDPRSSSPVHLGDELAQLFLDHPHVITYVAGHSHENLINPFPPTGEGGGFWEIKSPAIADWPPQQRMIEVMDNKDGTLSIFGTIVDHAANVEIPKSGTNAKKLGIVNLAAIGRVITFNDPQVGPPGGEGDPKDRNAELLIADPRAGATAQPETLGDDLPASGEDEPSDEELPVESPVEPPLGGPLPTELLP